MKKLLFCLCLAGLSLASFQYPMNTVTNTSVTVGTSNTTILAIDSTRVYACLENVGTDTVWLSFGATATQNKGIKLAANEVYEINDLNLYKGSIYGICVTTPSAVTLLRGSRVN